MIPRWLYPGAGGVGRGGGGKKALAPFPRFAGRQHSPFVAVRAGPLEREKGEGGMGRKEGRKKERTESRSGRRARCRPCGIEGVRLRQTSPSSAGCRGPALCRRWRQILGSYGFLLPGRRGKGPGRQQRGDSGMRLALLPPVPCQDRR